MCNEADGQALFCDKQHVLGIKSHADLDMHKISDEARHHEGSVISTKLKCRSLVETLASLVMNLRGEKEKDEVLIFELEEEEEGRRTAPVIGLM